MPFTRPAVLLFALTLVVGCGKPDENPAPEHTYTVRGQIAQLPSADGRLELLIEHESLPQYVNPDGSLGMPYMVMPFNPAPETSLDGFAIGDKVRFTWDVRFSAPAYSHIHSLEKLPADTELDFPAASTQPGHHHGHGHHHHGHDQHSHDHSGHHHH